MKLLKILAAAAAAAVIFTAAVSAGTIDSIEQVEQTALLNNLEYKTAVLEVMKAENALESRLKLESSSLSLAGSYGKQNSDSTISGFGYQASLSLPLFEQVSLSAAVDQDLKGTFGITVNPLNHSVSVEQTKLNYNQKLNAAAAAAAEITDAAVEKYLDWASASKDYGIQKQTAEVKKTLYDDEKVRYEKAEAELDDVRTAFTAWSDSRTAMNNAFTKLQNAESELYSTLNADPAEYEIIEPDGAALLLLIEAAESKIDSAVLSADGSISILNAVSAADSIELQLKNTWLFEPDLQLSGSIAVTPESVPVFSASASLSFSPEDWKASDIEELKSELEISRQQAVQTLAAARMDLQQQLTAVETAAINYEVAEVEMQQAKELLDEADFLYGLGEYSEAEHEETVLMYEQSQNSLFSAAAEHYKSLRGLLDFSG